MSTTENKVINPNGVSVLTLSAMVVGSMVGAGVFFLPARFSSVAGVFGAIIAWVVAGFGMLMLAFVFQSLAVRKPELDAGVFAYAKAGFGDFVGFNSAFGFWASASAGNAFYWVFVMTTIGKIWPALGEGDTYLAATLSVVGIWIFAWLIAKGVKGAAALNRIVTIAKLIPIAVFILLVAFAMDAGVFTDNFWGGPNPTAADIFEQVKGTMFITVFVFLGIEGASVYSRFARKRKDVGRATVLGFLSVLAVFSSITLLSYGIMPREDIAELRQPSMAHLLGEVVGDWGVALISIGVIVSVLGAYLAWTLMAVEVLYIPAKDKDMPKFLARENAAGAPITSLLLSSAFVSILVIVVAVFSEDALNFLLDLTTSLALIPYLLVAAYGLKLGLTGESFEAGENRTKLLVVGVLSTIYTIFLVYAAGLEFLLLSSLIYAPGIALYVMARRENRVRIFTPAEFLLMFVLVGGAIAAIWSLAIGAITI